MKVTVRGASDDLIEVEGDITEEFSYNNDSYLGFSDGTLLSVKYGDEGLWRINRLRIGAASYEKTEATDPDGDYSDTVTLVGEFAWCVKGESIASRVKR